MRKSAFIIAFLASHFAVFAQQNIDSLKYILDNYQSVDTVRVDLLNQIGYEYWIVDATKSDQYGEQAVALSQTLGYEKGEAFGLRVIGVANWARGNYEVGLIELLKSLAIYTEIEDVLGIADCNLDIGLIYADQQNFQRALTYYFRAVEDFQRLGRTDRVGTTYNKIGSIYIEELKLSEAYDYLIKALNIHQVNGFDYGISESNNRLGRLFIQRQEYTQGLTYLFQSLSISQKINDQEGIARNYENIGSGYLRQGKLNEAKKYFDMGLEVALEIGSKKWLRDIFLGLKMLALERNQYERALLFSDHYMAMKDSLFNEQMANRIAEMERRNEIEAKEIELEALKQETSLLEEKAQLNRSLQITFGVMLVLVLLSAYLIISRQRLKHRQQKERHETAQQLATAELENAQLKEEELRNTLHFKNKELTSYTINFIRKNQLMEELKASVAGIQEGTDDATSKKLAKLNRVINNALDVDRDWQDFKLHFENVHKDFFTRLKEAHPELGNSELKLCALIRLNLSMKETAAIMGISAESVKTARYRLRKKLQLPHEANLTDFIMMFKVDQKPAV